MKPLERIVGIYCGVTVLPASVISYNTLFALQLSQIPILEMIKIARLAAIKMHQKGLPKGLSQLIAFAVAFYATPLVIGVSSIGTGLALSLITFIYPLKINGY